MVQRLGMVALVMAVAACQGPTTQDEQKSRTGLGTEPSVAPVYVAGNPTCQDLGYGYEYKIDGGPYNGTFSSSDGYLTVTVTSADGVYASWTSNVGVDAVLMKGGNNANHYAYAPESTGDNNLSSPINPNNGTPYAISHISFCYDYEVGVTKTANTSFTRSYSWSIAKSASDSSLTLSPGQTYLETYSVGVTVESQTDSDFAVAGTITVTNPAPVAATITSVSDSMENLIAPVDCGVELPYVLAAGATLECTYSASLPDASSRTNVATVATEGEVGGNSGSAAVEFASATMNEVDECITVDDSMAGALGTVCVSESPKQFNYVQAIGPFASPEGCGDQSVVNVASFQSGDSGATGSASWTIAVTVPCSFGCTLTQGYWKTHSAIGPAPYDGTWAQIGENTPFFGSGLSWYQQFWRAPAGNAYFVLSHQYAAAVLNGLNGADTSAVASQIAQAAVLLDQYDGSPQPMSKITGQIKATFNSLAAALDSYNNGLTGPGHCSE